MSENWLPVPEYEGLYEVSDMGSVRSLDRLSVHSPGKTRSIKGHVLSAHPNSKGYLRVPLTKNNVTRLLFVHRLVLVAFIGSAPDGMEALHGPGGKADCRVANLSWGTHVQNEADKRRDGTALFGECHPDAKLTEADVRDIRALRAAGWVQQDIADRYGVSRTTVSEICRWLIWKHLEDESLVA